MGGREGTFGSVAVPENSEAREATDKGRALGKEAVVHGTSDRTWTGGPASIGG